MSNIVRATKRTLGERVTDQVIILADCSGSMAEEDVGDGRSRFAILKEALTELPANARILAFHDQVFAVPSAEDLPRPNGGTRLERALRAASFLRPIRTIVVSDGEPLNEASARIAAASLDGIIDVIYCGPSDNTHAKAFLESLARDGMGRFYATGDQIDASRQLTSVIRGLLGPRT